MVSMIKFDEFDGSNRARTGFVSRLEVPKVSDCNSQRKYEKVTLKHNHKFLIKIEIVVSLTLDSSVNLSPIIEPWRLGDGYKEFFLDAPDSGCWCLSHCFPPYPFHDSQYIVWDAGVSAIASHLTRSMTVSTSFGGDFKIWVCNSEKSQKAKDSS
ncbi:hypothetical protein Bca52824_085535 [Brassica carinata]|uniref:Uncharacterized protein n=1 Tax=Brassica carinata TaxID=52824 RepID=A0A8X7P8G8_BRACI|nr:hypothetical protein Bca52824_085535 [Brassica carinata]